MTTPDEQPVQWQDDEELPIEELARRQGVKPIKSVEELAQPDLLESDEASADQRLLDVACCIVRDLPLATSNIKDYADFAEHEKQSVNRKPR